MIWYEGAPWGRPPQGSIPESGDGQRKMVLWGRRSLALRVPRKGLMMSSGRSFFAAFYGSLSAFVQTALAQFKYPAADLLDVFPIVGDTDDRSGKIL